MDISVFTNPALPPVMDDLKPVLSETFDYWIRINDMVYRRLPKASGEWKYPGKNYGWSYRLKDKKRNIIYLLPRKGYFMVAFVFGQRAFEEVLKSSVSDSIKHELSAAKAYMEGRGIRLEVNDGNPLKDIEALIDIKLSF